MSGRIGARGSGRAASGRLGSGAESRPGRPGAGHFFLFAYGTLLSGGEAAGLLADCVCIGPAEIEGTLFDIDGEYPALMLYGSGRVHGEVWRCPVRVLWLLDEYEAVDGGLFRRAGIEVEGRACWTYVAGPALAHRLVPARRIHTGRW